MVKEKLVQSLTAYTCRICKKYHNENLLVKSDTNEKPLELCVLLEEFFEYIKRCKIDRYTGRAIMLSGSVNRGKIDDSIVRLHIHPMLEKLSKTFQWLTTTPTKREGIKAQITRRYTRIMLFSI